MKATGIVRRIDDLGRVVIPKEIRRTLKIRESEPLEIFTDRNGEIILKKYSPIGEFSSGAQQLADAAAKTCGKLFCICDQEQVVAAAGPVTYFILAVLFMSCFIAVILLFQQEYSGSTVYAFFYNMLQAGVLLNLVLAFFNLLPIPPMDGSRLLSMALPYEAARAYNELERYGMIIVLIFVASGLFRIVIFPLVEWCYAKMFLLFLQTLNLFM